MIRWTTSLIACLGIAVTLTACSDDDPASPEIQVNRDPAAVTLTEPTNGTAGVDGSLTLTWETAPDPDGDDVTYTLYLDETTDPTTEIATDLGETTHEVASAWDLDATYYWKVTASDGEGGTSTSPVWSFTTRGNSPPTAFDLGGVSNGATGVDASPTLTWEAATDPEGDPVVYDVYLDRSANPTTVVATDLTVLAHTVNPQLDIEETYFWKVVAKDDVGGTTSSEVRRFTTRPLVIAEQVTDEAAFAARSGHTSLIFDGKMWVIGGNTCCGGRYNDVWSSTDGETWTLVTDNAAFPARTVHASVVHEGRMWVIGGNSSYSSGNEFADVWSSQDGVNWEQVTAAAEFGPRYGHRAASFAGKLWVFAGRDAPRSYSRNQVWSSVDGASWTLETDDGQFGGTSGLQVVEFQGELWKTGGRDDKVFKSADGITWTQITAEAAYGNRVQHTSVVFDDKLWVISGSNDPSSSELPDVWFSSDGATWERAASDAGYQPVAEHTSLVDGGKMWIIGGGGGNGSSAVSNSVYTLGY